MPTDYTVRSHAASTKGPAAVKQMEILFIKLAHNRHEIVVRGRRGPDICLPARETGPSLPHDLAHAAVERALGLDDGFWSAVERGATYAGFEPLARRYRRARLEALARYEATAWAELAVAWSQRAGVTRRVTGRALAGPTLDGRQLARVRSALHAARTRWAALKEGEMLCWIW